MRNETLYEPILLNTIRANGFTAQDKLSGLFNAGVSEVLEIIQANETITVTDITSQCEDMTQSMVSHCLAQLRRSGLVQYDKLRKFKYYSIKPGSIERLNRICAGLAEGYRPERVGVDI